MIRKISLALVLMSMAGVASASGTGTQCFNIFGIEICLPSFNPTPVRAPEIDPASAMAGLTLLAGSLAVLRGRRSKVSKK